MKKVLFLVCLWSIIGVGHASTASLLDIKKSKIALHQLIATTTVKSAPATPAVEAYQNDTDLEIRFNRNLGNVNVVVTNKWGYPVYQQTVNAAQGRVLTIPTQSWAAGTYTIRILDGQGGGLEGQFVK